MKKLIVCGASAALLLTGCGSSPKESEPSASAPAIADSGSADEDHRPPPAAAAVAAPAPVTPKQQEAARGLLSGISDAIKSGNDEAVFRSATQVLAQNPNEVRALNAIGVYYYKQRRYLAAEYFFARANKVQASSELMNNQALTQWALGEKRDAIRLWKKALDLNPNDGVAAANLGSVYAQEKDYSKARITLENAVKRGVKDQRTLTNYGIAQAAGGQFDSAKLMYEEALKLNGNSHETLLNYAVLLIDHMGKSQEGMRQLDRLRFLNPDETIRKRMIELENKAKTEIK